MRRSPVNPAAYGAQNAERVRAALEQRSAALVRRRSLYLPVPELQRGERAPLETVEQQCFIRLCREYSQDFPALAYVSAIPNGGGRSRAQAGILLAEGVNAGVPDLMLPFPAGPYRGWFGEMKRLNATASDVSKDQHRWLGWLTDHGYWAKWHRGHAAMWNDLVDYLIAGEMAEDQ